MRGEAVTEEEVSRGAPTNPFRPITVNECLGKYMCMCDTTSYVSMVYNRKWPVKQKRKRELLKLQRRPDKNKRQRCRLKSHLP